MLLSATNLVWYLFIVLSIYLTNLLDVFLLVCGPHLCVLSFFSRALACCSLTMTAFTCGGFMWTLSFPPTRRRTVAANLVWVFNTWGGCFSMMKVLKRREETMTSQGATFLSWDDLSYWKAVILIVWTWSQCMLMCDTVTPLVHRDQCIAFDDQVTWLSITLDESDNKSIHQLMNT